MHLCRTRTPCQPLGSRTTESSGGSPEPLTLRRAPRPRQLNSDRLPACPPSVIFLALAERDGRERLRASRGKSELQRVDCQVTPGRRKATDRATENRPPVRQPAGKGETVG